MEVNDHGAVCYDLECIEHLFDAPKPVANFQSKFVLFPTLYGDAVDDTEDTTSSEMPRAAAEALEPDPEFAFNYPSNSTQALGIRQDKSNEIGEILSDVSKRRARLLTIEQPQRGDLVLKRPLDLSPGNAQYKKQGLTRYDKVKEKKLQLAPVSIPARKGREGHRYGDQQPTPKTTRHMPICYCRESHANDDIVKCSGHTCQIGAFHLHCCQIDKAPAADERFYCYYCAANFGVVDREAIVYGVPTEAEGGQSDNDAVMDAASNQVIDQNQMPINEAAPLTGSTLVDEESSPRSIASPQTDGSASHQKGTRKDISTRVLFMPGDRDITFKDLAPFVEADVDPNSPYQISQKEERSLLQWKSSCSPSRLIQSASNQHPDRPGLCSSAVRRCNNLALQVSGPTTNERARLSQFMAES